MNGMLGGLATGMASHDMLPEAIKQAKVPSRLEKRDIAIYSRLFLRRVCYLSSFNHYLACRPLKVSHRASENLGRPIARRQPIFRNTKAVLAVLGKAVPALSWRSDKGMDQPVSPLRTESNKTSTSRPQSPGIMRNLY